jgi:hypothetical protein
VKKKQRPKVMAKRRDRAMEFLYEAAISLQTSGEIQERPKNK